MTLKFINLYNTAASQEWSMYDGDAASNDELEKSLVIALNKAVSEILYSYPFSFRERTHIILANPKQKSYDLPKGLIVKNKSNEYNVKLNSKTLKLIDNPDFLDDKSGVPEGFYIKNGKIYLYPIPKQKTIITLDYITLALGEDKDGNEIFSLKNSDDVINIPEYLESLFVEAVISRCMLNVISAEGDENYSAYKKQSETSYRLLIKYSKGVRLDKAVKI